MSVVNCKVQFIRPQYKNLKEWMEDPKNVYVGRAGVVFIENQRFPKNMSSFANPFKIDKDSTRDEVIQKYKAYITDKLQQEPALQQELIQMKGKNLGCWCFPEPCHANVLIELIAEYCDYDYFEGTCCICGQVCNELSGWKCVAHNMCYCDDHNSEEFTCDC